MLQSADWAELAGRVGCTMRAPLEEVLTVLPRGKTGFASIGGLQLAVHEGEDFLDVVIRRRCQSILSRAHRDL